MFSGNRLSPLQHRALCFSSSIWCSAALQAPAFPIRENCEHSHRQIRQGLHVLAPVRLAGAAPAVQRAHQPPRSPVASPRNVLRTRSTSPFRLAERILWQAAIAGYRHSRRRCSTSCEGAKAKEGALLSCLSSKCMSLRASVGILEQSL